MPVGWGVVADVAHTGKQSLNVANDDPAVYVFPCHPIPALYGCKYRFSAWVKTDNVAGGGSGASICLQWCDAGGKWLGGCYPTGIKGTNGWTKISATTDYLPNNAASVSISPFLWKSCTGKAWFDDIRVEIVDDLPFFAMIRYPNYRSTIYPGMAKRIDVGVRVAGSAYYSTKDMSLSLSLIDSQGKIKSALKQDNLAEQDFQNLQLNIDDIAPGKYNVIVCLVSKTTGNNIREQILPVTIADREAKLPAVYIDEHNRCILNGQPFFPIGLFCSSNPNDVDSLDFAVSGRFNCVINYASNDWPPDSAKRYLDNAANRNLYVMYSLKDCVDGTWRVVKNVGKWDNPFNVLKGYVDTFKSHPAILGWYINDEMSGEFIPILDRNYSYIHDSDQNHLCWQVLTTNEDDTAHVSSTDVIGVDCYPVMFSKTSTPHIADHGSAVGSLGKAVMESRGMWTVAECSSWKGSRCPTYDEMMCECYQALVHGARGLFLWSYAHAKDDGDRQLDAIRRVGTDLNAIRTLALGIDATADQSVPVANDVIGVRTRIVGSDVWVLAVNPSYSSANACFTLPKQYSGISRVEVGTPGTVSRTIPVIEGKFKDEFGPLGVRAYHLALCYPRAKPLH